MTSATRVLFFARIAKVHATLNRRFNSGLGGLGFSEFIIMYYLGQVTDGRMRRIDLADKVGLTPSGVTRLLAPMEKIGLVKREAYERDARVSYVVLTAAGKRQLSESIDELDRLAEEIIPEDTSKNIERFSELLNDIATRAR